MYIDGVYEHRYTKDSGGTVTEEQTQLHVMDGRSNIATLRFGDPIGETVDAVYYTLEDHLGTSSTRLNTGGTVIDHEEYYPFGDSSLRTWEKKRYRYVGKEKDGESGLYYYGARYYMAWVGRFISVDPLADKYAQLTPYNYAANGPIGGLDVDGLQNTQTDTTASATTFNSGNPVFDKAASAFIQANPKGYEIEIHNIDGVMLGRMTSASEWFFYDSRQPQLAAQEPGGVVSIVETEGGPRWNIQKGFFAMDSNYGFYGNVDPFSPSHEPRLRGTAEEKLMIGSLQSLAERNGLSLGVATDAGITPEDLFDEWVFGAGSDVRVFDEHSRMGKAMLEVDYVKSAIERSLSLLKQGEDKPREFGRSLRQEPMLEYAATTIQEGLSEVPQDQVRAFHGSISGRVIPTVVSIGGDQYAMLRIVLWDEMSGESGTRYPPIAGGYDLNAPASVLPNYPLGIDGAFRTIFVYYDMKVIRKL